MPGATHHRDQIATRVTSGEPDQHRLPTGSEGRRRRATHPPSSAQQHIKRVDSYLHDSSLHAWRNNALSNTERDEIINRNLAKLVQIPAPCYKIGKGLPVGDVKRILGEAPRTRLYALYVLAATRLPTWRTPQPALVGPHSQPGRRRGSQDRPAGQRSSPHGRHQDRRLGQHRPITQDHTTGPDRTPRPASH
jgi:hypothetical protein